MGNCLSDPSTPKATKMPKSGGNRLGSAGPPPAAASSSKPPAPVSSSSIPPTSPGRVLGDGFEDPLRGQGNLGAREAALKAAEERAAKVSSLGSVALGAQRADSPTLWTAEQTAQRGISGQNPNAGKLSQKLAEHNKLVDSNKLPVDGREQLTVSSDISLYLER